ncbi:hypothetical protein [Veronia nyctiphanis]|uniref:hypothetical protein n=1 Tax=Veronia nyctiphanis TaxID=1278244 RepID=UPI00191C47C9|nr:hypothetical protein [Veronia nyctiphanis]
MTSQGYDTDFLQGVSIPLPTFSASLQADILFDSRLRDGYIADYPNFSLVMNKAAEKRSAAFVALNIDQSKFKNVRRIDNWRTDSRVGASIN